MGAKTINLHFYIDIMTMNQLLFIGGVGMQEVLLIALVILLLFGGKKIPELMNGLGKGVKSFKEGMNGTDNRQDGDSGNSADNKGNGPEDNAK